MITLKLHGRITEDGNIEVDEALNLPAGKTVAVTLEIADELEDNHLPEQSTAQVAQSGQEIVDFLDSISPTGWEYITDPVAWLEEQRRNRRMRYFESLDQ